MNCPNCKNPIQIRGAFCEWCGAELGIEELSSDNVFVVENYYKVLFKGIVLVGKFEKSIVISEGDEFVYLLKGETIKSVVKSIELNREFITDYSGNERIGISI
jgi:translation elongation factor EF-Tu-like GTPase